MADKKKMSVEDILAACRTLGAGGETAPAPKLAAKSTTESAESEPTVEKPTASKSVVKPGTMSVADILAAARIGKTAALPESKEKVVEAPKPQVESKTKPSVEKPAVAKAPPVALDTASILAAARGKAGKPGPVSKAEAAAKAKPELEGKQKIAVPPMPVKPAYAVLKTAQVADGVENRRGFFTSLGAVIAGSSLAVAFSSLAVTHLLWGLGLARFMFPNILTEPPTKFKVGFPDALAPGQVDERYKAQFGVWIVKHEYEGQSQIYALKTVCTHLGCTPSWLEAEQKYKCPCHGSGFYKDGINFEGPAPRPLERYAIRISDDGQLEVDKSRVFHEEVGQWSDSACYVSV